MRKLLWGKTFVRAVKRMNRRYSNLLEILQPTLQLLAGDPFAPQLETHKLLPSAINRLPFYYRQNRQLQTKLDKPSIAPAIGGFSFVNVHKGKK